MQAQEKKIQDVLSESRHYFIPDYQRPYSWETEQIEQLLEDVDDAFTRKDQEYFIGSLILIERDGGGYDVVDGQQRLTTLTIIFSAIWSLLTAEDQKSYVQQRFLPKHPMTKKTESPRLTVREQDRAWFLEAILQGKPTDEASATNESQLNMLRNRAFAVKFLGKFSADELVEFETFLETSVWVVWVSTPGFQSAFRLFNVLNARGVPLSNADLIKSHLYGLLSGNEIKRVTLRDAWAEIEELVGAGELDAFLSHYRTAHAANKPEEALYVEYEGLIDKLKKPADVFAKDLTRAAEAYRKIRNGEFGDSTETRRLMASLRRVHYDEWIPPLLAFIDAGYASVSVEEFVGWLEKLTYQNWIRRLSRTQRNTSYYQVIRHIRAGGDANGLRDLFRSNANANDKELLTFLGGEIYRNAYAKAVLMRLEEASQDGSVTKSFSGMISIEHVLPQKPTDAYWNSRFTAEEAQQWVHRLGNLTLLSGKKNSAAQNFPFDEKLKVFNERNSRVSFDLTRAVCTHPEWTLDVVKNRHSELLDRAMKVWKMG